MLRRLKFINYNVRKTAVFALVVCIISACGTTASAKRAKGKTKTLVAERAPLNDGDRARLLSIAKSALGKPSLKVGKRSFRSDCSGTIRAIFTKAKIGLGGVIKKDNDNDVKTIYRFVQKYGSVIREEPLVGDLVFFHNTYDRSCNGQMNDALTHVGLVEKVEGQTVHFIHHLGRSIIRSKMNLSLPNETYDPKTRKRINHILRRAEGQHRAFTAAQLFAGFGRL
ncbi:MAG TPA: NlpC/P60 family protein [Myxococcota bacterium]|nr:NlpC/P60 family protein [Myxococcota bacterium]